MERLDLRRAFKHLRRPSRFNGYPAAQKAVLGLNAVLILSAAAVVLCSVVEDTVSLPRNGRGLDNHYGIWAIFISSPLLVSLAFFVYATFFSTMRSLKDYTVGVELPKALQVKVKSNLDSLHLQKRSRFILWLFIIIGWYCWLINVSQTLYPFESYGNDVFDAYPHILGFISFKLYLGFLWILVYPTLAYLASHIFISMILLLKYMSEHDLFKLDFFHEDNCGGVSIFGRINILLLLMTFLVFGTVLAILFTHAGNYASIWVAVILSFILMVLQSVLGVYYIHRFVRQKKRDILIDINQYLNAALLTLEGNMRFPQELLAVRDHINDIRSFPYTKGTRMLLNTIRLSPAAVGLVHFIRGL